MTYIYSFISLKIQPIFNFIDTSQGSQDIIYLFNAKKNIKEYISRNSFVFLDYPDQEDRMVFEIHQNLMGRGKSNGRSIDASLPSVENASKVSHFLPSFRSPVGLSVAIRPLYSQASLKKNTRSLSENVEKKHSRKDITSYVSADRALEISEAGCRRKYLAKGKAIREESSWNPTKWRPLVGRINHDIWEWNLPIFFYRYFIISVFVRLIVLYITSLVQFLWSPRVKEIWTSLVDDYVTSDYVTDYELLTM